MVVCCPGPPVAELAWTPCLAGAPLEPVEGHVGMLSRRRGEECSYNRITWTTQNWPHAIPSVGDAVLLGEEPYWIDQVSGYGCVISLVLCQPIIDCPDCIADIVRLGRNRETCLDTLGKTLIAQTPAKICKYDQQKKVIDSVEVQVVRARICLGLPDGVEVGDLVVCNDTVWRIERIVSRCSAQCPLTIDGIREPWGILEETGPPQYVGSGTIDFGFVVTGVGDVPLAGVGAIPIPPLSVTGEGIYAIRSEPAVWELPIPDVTGEGILGYAGAGAARFGFAVTGQGEYRPSDSGTGTIIFPTLSVTGTGVYSEVGQGTVAIAPLSVTGEGFYYGFFDAEAAELTLPTLSVTGTGDYLLDPNDRIGQTLPHQPAYVGTLQVTGEGTYLFVDEGQGEIELTSLSVTGTGTYELVYQGDAQGVCGPWTNELGEVITNELGEPIEFAPGSCGVQLPRLQVTGEGTYQGIEYTGESGLGLCGVWTNELGEVITNELGEPIEFNSGECGIPLPTLKVTGSGLYTAPAADSYTQVSASTIHVGFGVTGAGFYAAPYTQTTADTIKLGALQVTGSGIYTGIQTYTQSLSPDQYVGGLKVTGVGDYTAPPSYSQTTSPSQYVGGLKVTGTGDYSDPSSTELVVPLRGGEFLWEGQNILNWPDGDNAKWRWSTVDQHLMDAQPLILTMPINHSGPTVAIATLRLLYESFGFSLDLAGYVYGWDVDNASTTAPPGWDGNYVRFELPNGGLTSANVHTVAPAQPQFVQHDIDVTGIVNEIMSRPGWQAGNRIMFVFYTDETNFPQSGHGDITISTVESGGLLTSNLILSEEGTTPPGGVPPWMAADGYTSDPFYEQLALYGSTPLGEGIDNATGQTIFDLGTGGESIEVSSQSAFNSACANARTNSTIKSILLVPLPGGAAYNWPLLTGARSQLSDMVRSPGNPLIIMTKPGSATQAKMTGFTAGANISEIRNLRGLCLVDIWFDSAFRLVPGASFQIQDVLFERCRVWLEVQGAKNTGASAPKIPGTSLNLPTNPLRNIVCRLCTIPDHWAPIDADFHGIYGEHIQTLLIEGCFIDKNGWGASRSDPPSAGGPNVRKHNVYINPYYIPDNSSASGGIVMRYNVLSRASNFGYNDKAGSHVYQNLFVRNPNVIQQGMGDDEQYAAYGLRQGPKFIDNVCLGCDAIAPGQEQGRGWTTVCTQDAVFERNYFLDKRIGAGEAYRLQCNYPINNVRVVDNRSSGWQSVTPILPQGHPLPCDFDPTFQQQSGNSFSSTANLSADGQAISNWWHNDANYAAMWDNRTWCALGGGNPIQFVRDQMIRLRASAP